MRYFTFYDAANRQNENKKDRMDMLYDNYRTVMVMVLFSCSKCHLLKKCFKTTPYLFSADGIILGWLYYNKCLAVLFWFK